MTTTAEFQIKVTELRESIISTIDNLLKAKNIKSIDFNSNMILGDDYSDGGNEMLSGFETSTDNDYPMVIVGFEGEHYAEKRNTDDFNIDLLLWMLNEVEEDNFDIFEEINNEK